MFSTRVGKGGIVVVSGRDDEESVFDESLRNEEKLENMEGFRCRGIDLAREESPPVG